MESVDRGEGAGLNTEGEMGLGDLVVKKARLANTTEEDGVGGKEKGASEG